MRKNYAVFFVIISLLFLESCSVQKRQYMDGCYVQWNHPKPKSGNNHNGRTEVKFLAEGEDGESSEMELQETNSEINTTEAKLPVVAPEAGVRQMPIDTIPATKKEKFCKTPKIPKEDPTLPLHPELKYAKGFAWAGWGAWVASLMFFSFAPGIPALGWGFWIAASLLLLVSLIFACRVRSDFKAGTEYRGKYIARNVIIVSALFYIIHALALFFVWLAFYTGSIRITF